MKIGRTPKWQHTDPLIRLAAIQEADIEQSDIESLAATDPDPAVRCAAISRLDNEAQLLTLVTATSVGAERDAATSRLAERYGAHDTLPDQPLPDALLMAILRTAGSTKLRLDCVARLTDEQTLTGLLMEEQPSKVWQACAEKIHQPALLEQVHKHFLSRDKNVVHIVKAKQQQLHDQQAAAAQHLEQCETIANALIDLANSDVIGDYVRRFNLYSQQWQALTINGLPEQFSQALASAVAAALAKSNAIIARMQADADAQTSAATQVVEALESLTLALQASNAGLNQLAHQITEARRSWPAETAPAMALQERFDALLAPLDGLQQQYALTRDLGVQTSDLATRRAVASDIQWPEDFPQPDDLQQQLQAIEDEYNQTQQQQQHWARELASLAQRFTELDSHIHAGRLKPATRLQGNLGKKIETLKTSPGAASHKRELAKWLEHSQVIAARLTELRDWQGFATNPKRQELCEAMEQLRDDAAISPDEKAKAIKEMQVQWKELGASDSAEGQKLWSRFKLASDGAYAPCAVYFQQQKSLRAENLKNRQAICSSLELFEKENTWDQADWKAVNDIIAKAQREWQIYKDIPQHKYKQLQTRFTKITGILRARVNQEQKHNHEKKQALITALETMLASDAAANDIVELCKKSQRAWQQVGICDRRVDQKLWKQFRQQCDLAFERRDTVVKEVRKAASATRQAAQQVCQQLRQQLDQDDIDRTSLQQLQKQFRQIALEREDTRLRKEFDQLCKQATQAIKTRGANQLKVAMTELRRLAGLCQQLEQGHLDQDQVEAAWPSEISIPDAWRKRVEARRRQSTLDSKALTANQAEAETLCVRIEILAGLESPASAQQRRMQYQVERLNRELSQGLKESRTPDEQLREIQLDWYCLGPVADDAEALSRRFGHAEAKLGAA